MLDETLLMQFSDPERLAFWVEEKSRYQDLDPNSHINNIAFLAYVEACRIEYRASLAKMVSDAALGRWVVAASGIKFLSSGHYPGQIRVGTAPLTVGRTSFSLGFGIFQDEECLAVAGSRSVHVDAESGKPKPLPDELVAQLKAAVPEEAS